MTALVVLVAVVTVVALAQLAWRVLWAERRSIHHYEHAMEVLKDLSTRTTPAQGKRRAVDPTRAHVYTAGRLRVRPKAQPTNGAARTRQPAGGAAAAIAAAAVSARQEGRAATVGPATLGDEPDLESAPTRSRATKKLVFVDEAGLGGEPAPTPPGGEAVAAGTGPPHRRRSRRAARSPRRSPTWFRVLEGPRPRRAHVVVAVASVVVIGAVIGGLLATSGSGSRPGQPVAAAQPSSGTHQVSSAHHHPVSSPPPTVATVTPVSTDAYGAVLKVATADYTVVLNYSGRCWTQVNQGQNGPQLWVETPVSGETRSVPSNGGPVWIRVGDAANVSLTVNGVTVPTPTQAGNSPYDFSFVPA
jgi:hypothetical protein